MRVVPSTGCASIVSSENVRSCASMAMRSCAWIGDRRSSRCQVRLTGVQALSIIRLHHDSTRNPRQAGLKLRKEPVRPTWKPLYARHEARIESWSKFVSEAYWEVRLEA